jgi:BirA family transcriptional regulator, biotin operon repressor / biotin---[acetyl-CoA-carboxylase] ligase
MTGKLNIIDLQQVDSTNSYAATLLQKDKVEEGTIIWAKEQTAGRGSGTNKWESEAEKNLTFSMILFPEFLAPDNQFLLNKIIALGVVDFLQGFNLKGNISIKWPNDIYLEYNKLGGILIDTTIKGDAITSAIVGIGLNINQIHFINEIPNPVSLKQILGFEISLRTGLESLVNNLLHRYRQLRDGELQTLESEYMKHLLGYQQWRKFMVQNQLFEGKIDGVDKYGGLKMISRNGEHRVFNHGEIEFLFK